MGEVVALPWPDEVVEKVAQHLWHCTKTRHILPWSELPEVVKRGARQEVRVIEQIVRGAHGPKSSGRQPAEQIAAERRNSN